METLLCSLLKVALEKVLRDAQWIELTAHQKSSNVHHIFVISACMEMKYREGFHRIVS